MLKLEQDSSELTTTARAGILWEVTVKVGILSQWFDPESGGATLPGVLARGLVAQGHQVQVVTGFPNYPQGRLYPGFDMSLRSDTEQEGYSLRRVALYPDHSTSVRGRVANYVSFAASAAAVGAARLLEVDALWVYNSPATIALPMWVVQGLGRVPTVLHNMDMWPDSVLQAGFLPRRGARYTRRGLETWVSAMYRTADIVAYISRSAGDELARRGVPPSKLRFAPVWIDEAVFRPVDGSGLRRDLGYTETEVVVSYAGALGRAQGVGTLVDAVLSLPESLQVKCLVMGSGTDAATIAQVAKAHPNRVKFLGQIPHREMTDYAAAADLCYVGLADVDGSRFTAPSKVAAIMATAKPILAAASGDTAELVRAASAGFVARPSDARSVANAIIEGATLGRNGLAEVGQAARHYYLRERSADAGVQRVIDMLQEARSRRRRGSNRA